MLNYVYLRYNGNSDNTHAAKRQSGEAVYAVTIETCVTISDGRNVRGHCYYGISGAHLLLSASLIADRNVRYHCDIVYQISLL